MHRNNMTITTILESFDKQIVYRAGDGSRWNCMSLDEERLLKSFIRTSIQSLLEDIEREIGSVEPSPNLDKYLDIVKNGNMDNMYDYGVALERDTVKEIINKYKK